MFKLLRQYDLSCLNVDNVNPAIHLSADDVVFLINLDAEDMGVKSHHEVHLQCLRVKSLQNSVGVPSKNVIPYLERGS